MKADAARYPNGATSGVHPEIHPSVDVHPVARTLHRLLPMREAAARCSGRYTLRSTRISAMPKNRSGERSTRSSTGLILRPTAERSNGGMM